MSTLTAKGFVIGVSNPKKFSLTSEGMKIAEVLYQSRVREEAARGSSSSSTGAMAATTTTTMVTATSDGLNLLPHSSRPPYTSEYSKISSQSQMQAHMGTKARKNPALSSPAGFDDVFEGREDDDNDGANDNDSDDCIISEEANLFSSFVSDLFDDDMGYDKDSGEHNGMALSHQLAEASVLNVLNTKAAGSPALPSSFSSKSVLDDVRAIRAQAHRATLLFSDSRHSTLAPSSLTTMSPVSYALSPSSTSPLSLASESSVLSSATSSPLIESPRLPIERPTTLTRASISTSESVILSTVSSAPIFSSFSEMTCFMTQPTLSLDEKLRLGRNKETMQKEEESEKKWSLEKNDERVEKLERKPSSFPFSCMTSTPTSALERHTKNGMSEFLPTILPIRLEEKEWDIVLLVDIRERYRVGSNSTLRASSLSGTSPDTDANTSQSCLFSSIVSNFPDITVRDAVLPVGDFLWAAEHRLTKQRIVLDFIIERKRVSDLIGSIKDNRYREQRFRLSQTNFRRIVYLVEGPIRGEAENSLGYSSGVGNNPPNGRQERRGEFGGNTSFRRAALITTNALWGALHTLQSQYSFQIMNTSGMTQTIQYLRAMHHVLLQEYMVTDQEASRVKDVETCVKNFYRVYSLQEASERVGEGELFEGFQARLAKNAGLTAQVLFAKMLRQIKGT